MNKTKAWILAVGVAAVIAAGSLVALAGHDGGGSRASTSHQASTATNAQQAVGTTDTAPISPAPSPGIGPSASAEQIQQAIVSVLAGALTPVDGQLKAVSPAEIDARVRAELAKVGLQP
ncbi:MAG: hypothetical protein QOH66_2900 [Actinomycetota bacterium]|nr:hypothetical protein [Actinomycetota bacterium]